MRMVCGGRKVALSECSSWDRTCTDNWLLANLPTFQFLRTDFWFLAGLLLSHIAKHRTFFGGSSLGGIEVFELCSRRFQKRTVGRALRRHAILGAWPNDLGAG